MHLSDTEHRVAVIAANPEAAESDFLEYECETIREAFNNSRKKLAQVEPIRARSRSELAAEIKAINPTIIHFTAHGSPRSEVEFLDSSGWSRKLTSRTLSILLLGQSQERECIVFSGCRIGGALDYLSAVSGAVFQMALRKHSGDIAPIATRQLFKALTGGVSYVEAFNSVKASLFDRWASSETRLEFWDASSNDVPMFSRTPADKPLGQSFKGLRDQDTGDLESYVIISGKSAEQRPSLELGSEGEEKWVSQGAAGHERKPKEGFLYRVWFGTNRELVDKNILEAGFGAERSDVVRYGFCDVAIPKYHEIGSIGAPWWKRGLKFWRNNRLTMASLVALPEEIFWGQLTELFEALPIEKRALLIFIHGYNVKFEAAAIRAAQLGVDLDVSGATAFFSWPSKGIIKGYAADVAAIEDSAKALGDFVVKMANEVGAQDVYLISHSMGNRGLLRAFTTIFSGIALTLKAPLRQLFLAAPDIDKNLFQQLASVYPSISNRTTMYVSDKDKALLSSGLIHDFPRAGYSPPVTVVGGIDTIEVSDIDLTFLGHGYYAEAMRVLQDMKFLMEANLPPDKRFGLKPHVNLENKEYWKMRS